MLEKIIYIVGSPRSVSSLIYNAICSNNIFNPGIPENHIAANFTKYCFQQIYRNNEIEKKYIFNSENDTKDFFKSCLAILFKKISNKYNVNHLVLKKKVYSQKSTMTKVSCEFEYRMWHNLATDKVGGMEFGVGEQTMHKVKGERGFFDKLPPELRRVATGVINQAKTQLPIGRITKGKIFPPFT